MSQNNVTKQRHKTMSQNNVTKQRHTTMSHASKRHTCHSAIHRPTTMSHNNDIKTTIDTLLNVTMLKQIRSHISCANVAAILGLVFGYLGTFIHKPMVVAVCTFIMGFGNFFMCLPHLLAGNYDIGSLDTELCELSGE